MQVGVVTGTLKGDASSWVAEGHRARAALGQVRIEAQQLTGALAQTTAAAKANEAAKMSLAKSAQQAKGQMAGLAGSMGQMSGAMGAMGGEAQKLTMGMSGLVGAIGTGGLGMVAAAAGVAMSLLTAKMKEQEQQAEDLEKKWRSALAAFVALRDEQAKKRFEAEDQSKVLTLREQGKTETQAQAFVAREKAIADAASMRAAAENALGAAKVALAQAYSKEMERANALAEQGGSAALAEFQIRKRAAEELAKGTAAADEAYRGQAALSMQRENDANRTFGLTLTNEARGGALDANAAAAKEAAKADASHIRAMMEREAQLDEARIALALARLREEEQISAARLNAEMAAAAALDEVAAQRRAEEEAAAMEAARVAEAYARIADEMNTTVSELLASFSEKFAATIDDIAGMASAAVTGSGGRALGSFGGAAAGGLASMALGDPTGMIGSSVGGALGGMLGGLVDELAPLQEAGSVFVDALGIIAHALTPLFEPLVTLAQVFRLTAELAAPFLEGFALFGSLIELGARLAGALAPLLAAFITLYPPVLLLGAAIPALTGFINDALVPAMGAFYDAMVGAAIGILDFVNDLTGDNVKSLVKMESTLRSLDSFTDMVNKGKVINDGFDDAAEFADDSKEALKAAIRDGTRTGTIEGLEAFNRNVRNLPGYKDLPGAEFASAAGGQPTVSIGSVTFVVQQPLTMNEVAKRAMDYQRHGSIVAQSSSRSGNGPRRN